MSRVGQKPVQIASGVEVKIEGRKVIVKGKKGTLSRQLPAEVSAKVENGAVTVTPINNAQRSRAMWGMSRALIATMVEGVTNGYAIKLNIEGVGYRAAATGKSLQLNLGFSHPVDFPVPEGIEIKTPKPTEIEISGADKQVVGQVAANIRAWKKPEPYKGKGIAYASVYGGKGETIRRKEGKKK
jgi:large subunit ribosomal protein L6